MTTRPKLDSLLKQGQAIGRFCLTIIILSALSACDSGGGGSSDAEEEEFVSIFFREGQVLSYDEETNTVVSRAEYDNDLFLTMDTNAETNHLDFAVFVKDNELLSINYLSGRVIAISEFTSPICDLIRSNEFIEDGKGSTVVSQLSLWVQTASDTSCSSDFQYARVSFSLEPFSNAFTDGDDFIDIDESTITFTTEAEAVFTIPVVDRDNSDEDRRYGFLRYDPLAETLQLLNSENVALWTHNSPGTGSNATIKLLDNEIVFIRLGTSLFLLSTRELFDAGFFESGGGAISVPSGDEIEELFRSADLTLSGNLIRSEQVKSAGNGLLFLDNGRMVFVENVLANPIVLGALDPPVAAIDFSFDLISSSLIAVKYDFADQSEIYVMRYSADSANFIVLESIIAAETDMAIRSNTLIVNAYGEPRPLTNQRNADALFYSSEERVLRVNDEAQWLVLTDWKDTKLNPLYVAFDDETNRSIYALTDDGSSIESSTRINSIPLTERFAFEDHLVNSNRLALINYAITGNIDDLDLNTHLVELDSFEIGRSIE